METIQWPTKTHEKQTNHFDSTAWNEFEIRDDDIVVSTYAKSGTTWVQQIISQLIFNGKEGIPVAEISPWLDLRVPPTPVKHEILGSQTHRRFIKTHLPVESLVFSPRIKYVYVARDGRDVVWSLYNHHIKANDKWYGALNETPGLVGDPMPRPDVEVVDYYLRWLEEDGYPFWSQWENVRSWWNVRNLPNVKLVHFANLKKDMEGQIRGIADFLGYDADRLDWDAILKHCSFDYMKSHAALAAPLGGIFWEGGAESFINKGTNGRWRDMLTEQQANLYVQRAYDELDDACAHWLITGEMR